MSKAFIVLIFIQSMLLAHCSHLHSAVEENEIGLYGAASAVVVIALIGLMKGLKSENHKRDLDV